MDPLPETGGPISSKPLVPSSWQNRTQAVPSSWQLTPFTDTGNYAGDLRAFLAATFAPARPVRQPGAECPPTRIFACPPIEATRDVY